VNPSARDCEARLRGLFPTNRHPCRSVFYSGVRDLRGLDWGTAMPRRSGAVRARHAVPQPADGSGRFACHGRPRLFQTKLINIRADPSHPCRSVFYSGLQGEARLHGLYKECSTLSNRFNLCENCYNAGSRKGFHLCQSEVIQHIAPQRTFKSGTSRVRAFKPSTFPPSTFNLQPSHLQPSTFPPSTL